MTINEKDIMNYLKELEIIQKQLELYDNIIKNQKELSQINPNIKFENIENKKNKEIVNSLKKRKETLDEMFAFYNEYDETIVANAKKLTKRI